jgi:hypothetical protein
MAIRFVNIRSNEQRVAETEPQIAALWASSDHSPNITQGQDFGWRLAPQVVVELKKMKQDIDVLERVAKRFNKALEDLTEVDLLHWISNRTKLETAPVAEANDYQDDYDMQVRALEAAQRAAANKNLFANDGDEAVKPLATMSDEELEAELLRRKASASSTTTTTTTKEKA